MPGPRARRTGWPSAWRRRPSSSDGRRAGHEWLPGLWLEHPVHGEPAREGIEPAGAGRFLGVHAEAVTTLFIEVELGGLLGRTPAVDQPETAIAEKGIVGGERDEQRRSVGGDGPF